MDYTVEQYNALNEAIASSALTAKYADKEVTYRSLTDMIRIQGLMKTELFPNPTNTRRKRASYSKGLYPTCE
jgi:hypothetical protein